MINEDQIYILSIIYFIIVFFILSKSIIKKKFDIFGYLKIESKLLLFLLNSVLIGAVIIIIQKFYLDLIKNLILSLIKNIFKYKPIADIITFMDKKFNPYYLQELFIEFFTFSNIKIFLQEGKKYILLGISLIIKKIINMFLYVLELGADFFKISEDKKKLNNKL